jgi:hypothetical protein
MTTRSRPKGVGRWRCQGSFPGVACCLPVELPSYQAAPFPSLGGETANCESLSRMKAAVDGESEAVQHAGCIAEEKTNDTRDVFALGESA